MSLFTARLLTTCVSTLSSFFLIAALSFALSVDLPAQTGHSDKSAASTEQKATSDQKASTPPKPTQEELLAKYTLWLAIATAVLASATVALCVFTVLGARHQSRDMQESIKLARDANAISVANINADQRPWIAVDDLRFQTDLVFEQRQAEMPFTFRIINIGKTPALILSTRISVVDVKRSYNVAEGALETIVREERKSVVGKTTKSLLPNQSFRETRLATLEADENSDELAPVIVGCVTYKIGMDQAVHQTTFAYYIFECQKGEPHAFVCNIDSSRNLERDGIGWETGFSSIAT